MKEACFYEHLEDTRVRCLLCPHSCVIPDGRTGICRIRKNDAGTLTATMYAECTSAAMDPIEKKPLYHFCPGTKILSLGTNGCNFKCPWCQNWEISQQTSPTFSLTPEEAVREAKSRSSVGIAYTYNEPLVWFEYVRDTAELAREAGLKNVLVTNGFINPEPFEQLLPLIDAMNIDIKSIRPEFYREFVGANLDPVLLTAKRASKATHVEITNLIIPGHSDSIDDLQNLAKWISDNLGPETPTHLSAYFPSYKFTAPPTRPDQLEKARELFLRHLNYVYVGNVVSEEGSNTYCKNCNALLIKRVGYSIHTPGLEGFNCKKCGSANNIRC